MNETKPSVPEVLEGQAVRPVRERVDVVQGVQAEAVLPAGVERGPKDKPTVEQHRGDVKARQDQSALARRIFRMKEMGYSEAVVAWKLKIPVSFLRREIADL